MALGGGGATKDGVWEVGEDEDEDEIGMGMRWGWG